MKRIYLFRKKIGFPVCKKEISPAFKRTGRAERALVPVLLRITHHLRSWVLVSLPNLYPPCSFPLIVPRALSYFPSPQSPFDTKGSLSNNDGDGFKLCSSYSISFNTSNVGNIIGSWILLKGLYQRSGKEKRKLLSCVPVLDKTWIRHFHTSSLATTANKCTKSVMHVQSCCFANLNLLRFCRSRSRCRRRRRCLTFLTRREIGERERFLRNCPPTPPLS